jgi:hypothetical protein
MSFKILYQEGATVGVTLYTIAIYVNSFAKSLGINELNVNPNAFQEVASALLRPDFPHKDGIEKASPFKKAANFFVWFVAAKPILDEFPDSIITSDLKRIVNHQNVILAYHMAVDCLHGAQLHKNGGRITLDRKIRVSQHFFHDFVEAYSAATPVSDFKQVSLLFEQLAYKANPGASYEEII